MATLLKYKQQESKPFTIIERFGRKEFQNQTGVVDYEQQEIVEDDMIENRIAELKSISNRSYHSFTTHKI